LQEIYNGFELTSLGVPDFATFFCHYEIHNNNLWDFYRNGKIEKEYLSIERFHLTLKDFNIENTKLSEFISKEYIEKSPRKTTLFPYTHEALNYLKAKYSLHIITNGFKEIQHRKVELCGLSQYFTSVIVSEETGYKKPDRNIFLYSLKVNNALSHESIMIGDDLVVDILAAKAAGMDQIYVNFGRNPHDEEISFEISSLKELIEIL
jgi:putative hydrolase of the HAD superfamily